MNFTRSTIGRKSKLPILLSINALFPINLFTSNSAPIFTYLWFGIRGNGADTLQVNCSTKTFGRATEKKGPNKLGAFLKRVE